MTSYSSSTYQSLTLLGHLEIILSGLSFVVVVRILIMATFCGFFTTCKTGCEFVIIRTFTSERNIMVLFYCYQKTIRRRFIYIYIYIYISVYFKLTLAIRILLLLIFGFPPSVMYILLHIGDHRTWHCLLYTSDAADE